MSEILVIGGGILGTSVAYHLSQREGASVTLFERADTLGSETTRKSSLGFRGYGTNETQIRMKRYGRRLYNEFMADGSGIEYEPTEVLYAATTAAGSDTVERTRANEHPDSSPSEIVPGSALREVLVVPDIDHERVETALYRPNAGYFRSAEALIDAFVDRAVEAGATVETGTEITGVVVENGRVEGVVADGSRRAADTVVCAAGPWNNEVAAMADIEIPLRQRRLHLLELEPADRLARILPKIRHVETGVMFRGRPNGNVLVYRSPPAEDPYGEANVYDPDEPISVPEHIRNEMLGSVRTIVPALEDATVVDEGVAYTSRTPDGNPIAGWTERSGLSIAATHSRGIQYAPAVGDVVARQLIDGDPTTYYPDVSIARFDGYADSHGE